MAVYFWPMILQIVAWSLVKPGLTLAQPFFINRILQWATQRDREGTASRNVGFVCVIGLFASTIAKTLCTSEASLMSRRLGMRMQAIMASEVYSKILRRRESSVPNKTNSSSKDGSEQRASAGKAQNIVSNDVERSESDLVLVETTSLSCSIWLLSRGSFRQECHFLSGCHSQ